LIQNHFKCHNPNHQLHFELNKRGKEMKKIIFTLLIVLTFVVPSASYAAGWTGFGDIADMSAGHGNVIILNGNWPTPDPDGCGFNEHILELVITDDVNGRNRAALIMSAFMARKSVNLYVNGCNGSRPRADYFRVTN
jgi:hypothetical protein